MLRLDVQVFGGSWDMENALEGEKVLGKKMGLNGTLRDCWLKTGTVSEKGETALLLTSNW